jgi:uncharacterized protein Usg
VLPVLLHPGASHFTAHASGLTAAHVLATLASAPVLADLSTWCDWDSLYAPRLGLLPAFLAHHQQQLGFSVLEVPGGGLIKLPAAADGGKLDLVQLRLCLQQALQQVRIWWSCRVALHGPSTACNTPGSSIMNQAPLAHYTTQQA